VRSVANCSVPWLIQQNDGSGGFNRSWEEFKVGFGDRSGNYWLGNDLLSQLTANNRYKLRIDLQQDGTGNWYHAEYSTFRVLSEADHYTLLVSGFSGNANHDAFGRYHNGQQFSTINTKNCSLSIVLTATDQKPQKSLKRSYYPPSHCLNVNVMLSNQSINQSSFYCRQHGP